MVKNVKLAKKALCMALSFLMIAAMLTVTASADGETVYGSLISAEVSACESQAAVDAFQNSLAQPRSIDNEVYHSGTGSIKVSVSSANVSYVGFTPSTPLAPGALYRFSIWYKDSRETPEGRLQLRARAGMGTYILSNNNDYATKGGNYANSGYKSILPGWNKYEVLFYPTNAMLSNDFSFFYLTSDSAVTRYMNFDDIVFERVSPYDAMIMSEVSDCESSYATSSVNLLLNDGPGLADSGKVRTVSTAYKHSGDGSIAVTSSTDNYLALFSFNPKQEITAGETYCFSMWYNDPDGAAGTSNFEFVVRGKTSGGQSLCSQKLVSGGWQKYVSYFTVPSTHAGSNFDYFYVRASGFSSGTVYFDDIKLRKVDANEVCYDSGIIDADIAACESDYSLYEINTCSYNDGFDSSARAVSTVNSHNGSGSIEVTVPGAYKTIIGIKPRKELTVDKQYKFSFWYYNPENITGRIFLRFTSINGNSISNWITGTAFDSSTSLTSGGWTKYEYAFTGTSKLATDLKYFYVSVDGGAGKKIYFDDFSLVEAPTDETVCETSDCGKVDIGSPMTVEFNKEIDGASLPTTATVDGDKSVNISASAGADGKSVSFAVMTTIDEGQHNISFTVKDIWGRDVSVDTEFDLVYTDLIDANIAACESANAINAFNTYKVGNETKVCDNNVYHSGTGSVKVSVTSGNLSYIGFRPNYNLLEGEGYYFSVWYYDTRAEAEGNLILRGRSTENSPILMNETAHPIETGGWKKYECVFKATADLSSNLSFLYLTSDSSETRYMYFDDIVLKKINPYINMLDQHVTACESNFALNRFKENTISSDAVERTIDNENYNSGNGSLKVVLSGGYKSYVGVKPVVSLIEGETYRFSAWYYNPDNITGTMYLRYAQPNVDAIGNWITGTSTDTTDCGAQLAPGWNQYEYIFTAKADMTGDNFKYLYLTVSTAEGTLYFDDVLLQRMLSDSTVLESCNTENGEMVESDKRFSFTFNHELNESSLSQGFVTLNNVLRHDAKLSLSDDSKTLTVWFANSLQKGRTYSLSIKNIYDLWGRKLNFDAVTFKTVGDFNVNYNIYSVVDGQRVAFSGDLTEATDVVVEAQNDTFEEKSFVLLAADYNDGKLADVNISDRKTLSSDMSTIDDFSLGGTNADSVKLFVFDNMSSLNPLVPKINVFPKNEAEASSAGAAKYLVDEIWTGAISYDNVLRPSGWDVNRDGGSISNAQNAFVVINDTSESDAVTMEKELSETVSNNLTFETSFKLSSASENFYVNVGGGAKTALKVVTGNSYVCYENDKGQLKVLSSLSANQTVGFKAVFDIINQSVAVYLNGAHCGDIPFKTQVNYLDRIGFATSDAGKLTATIGYVKVYENYLVNESFGELPEGLAPDGFISEGNVAAFVESNTSANTDGYLKLSGSNAKFKAEFISGGNKLYGGFKFLLPTSSDAANVNIGNGISLSMNGGTLYCNSAALCSYRDNLWYQADFEIDTENSRATLKLNGKTLSDNIAVDSTATFTSLEFISQDEMWIDDVTVYDKGNDYTVPEIRALNEDDYLIGMQTYFMWHEGTHYGWDRIAPYPERKPYLGWYTDGNPEVSDWEIKWMKEHGIDYEIFPWARSDTNKNAAIKRPVRSDALHDGYFNAKNSDSMKFALMWSMISSSTLGGSEDFRNNIVPYWLEYYFKDSRYLLIDNKPFLSIYGYSNLVSVLGSEEAVKAEFDYLRSACISAGFDGIYLVILTSETDSSEEFTKIGGLGADAIYSYHWFYGSNTANYQIESIRRQIAKSPVNAIPYVSMGWNPQPWLGMPGEFCSLEDYETALSYSKERVDALKQSGDINHKMVIVGNWNEYGEGHFVMPSNVEGFGYLDKIRKVFTSGGDAAHTDDVPSAEQIKSMGNLYKQDRVVEKVIPEPTDISDYTTVIKSWEFNSFLASRDWSYGNITNFSSSGGVLKGKSTGIDPVITLKNDIDLDITDADYVKVRMKLTNSASCSASVMFTTADYPEFGQGKYVSFGVYHEGFYDYYVYMKSNSRWHGTLKKIRIDPMESVGNFEIDSIQILKKTNTQ